MSDFTPVDSLLTAARHVSREYGEYGYSLRVIDTSYMNTLCELRHSDGSRRLFLCDRYSNVEDAPVAMDASSDYTAWCMKATDRLYARRNSYQPSDRYAVRSWNEVGT